MSFTDFGERNCILVFLTSFGEGFYLGQKGVEHLFLFLSWGAQGVITPNESWGF